MSLIPERFAQVITEATDSAYHKLSKQRRYEVSPGASVCYLIHPDVSSQLISQGYDVPFAKLEMTDETKNWVLLFNQDGLKIDLTWLSCIPSNLREGLPEIIVYRSRNEVEGLNGEKIPENILDLYFGQFL